MTRANQARAYVEEHLNWQVIAGMTIEVYEGVCGEGGNGER
jgi:glycosyltransferase involved in cell wall biosynthesis